MLGVQDQRNIQRAHEQVRRFAPCSRCRKCPAIEFSSVLHLDARAVAGEVVPVNQHRREGGQQPVGDIARLANMFDLPARAAPCPSSSSRCAGHPSAGPRSGSLPARPAAARAGRACCPAFVYSAPGIGIGQLLVDQQMRNLFEGGMTGQVVDIVAAVMQLLPVRSDRADRRLAGFHPRKRHRFLLSRLHLGVPVLVRLILFLSFANNSSSFCS